MHNFWTALKFELFLTWRNWATWLVALAMVIIGALCATNNRHEPWGSWGQIVACAMFLGLILTFSTGNQIDRDRSRKLDGVIFSTPVATQVYVLAKYCAALCSLLCLASLSLLAALLIDQFYNVPQKVLIFSPGTYPSLGIQAYLRGWAWTVPVPVIFGAILMLAGITITHGKRVIAYIIALPLWIIPVVAWNNFPNSFADITIVAFRPDLDPAGELWFRHVVNPNIMSPAQFTQQIMLLSRAGIPPASLMNVLLWNRLFFVGLSLILLALTIYSVQRARRRV